MKEIWELCRKLSNPERLELLRKIYRLKGEGMSVNAATDGSALAQPATSQYLRQLLDLGLLRRERRGPQVFYSADSSEAPAKIAEIATMLYHRFQSRKDDDAYLPVFDALGNAFRARVVGYIAAGGNGRIESLAAKYEKPIRLITRDLKPLVDTGVMMLDSDGADGVYKYVPPSDEIARRTIELLG